MSTILITGVSGFIGRALAEELAKRHTVIGMSRKDPGLMCKWIRGDFSSFEDLRKLDGERLEVVVHLAAVTGGCLERDGMLVNVEGTRCLMRYGLDRGCRKFVFASSIAAMGIQSVNCRPLQVPIPDEHPCGDRDGYGFSKFMMEEVIKYHHRQNPDLDAIALRLAAICPDDPLAPTVKVGPLREWALGSIAAMARSDAVRAFALAAEAPLKPGVRIMNATPRRAWAADPVAKILRGWWGEDVALSHYEKPGHEFDSVYDVCRIEQELGFVARITPKKG
ncbi:MAG: NAD(P)-dependent oxidoreductase [Kiritimatiellae bacterium]|nr:NAD(P)-dependent oxidoreductase [Kiritimatiellia bacterium]